MKNVRWLVVICTLYLVSLAGSVDLYEINGPEPKRAVVSVEMYLSGKMVVPTIHGEAYYNKPPLFNWVQLAFFKIFHSFDKVICRLPGLLSLLMIAFLLFFLTKSLFDRRTAIMSFLVFLTFSHIYYYGSVRSGSLDLFFSLIIFLQIGSIVYFAQKRRYFLLFLISYFFAALGFLTKGLPSILSQLISLSVVFIYYRNFRRLFSARHFAGIILFLSIIASYFYIYSKQGDAEILFINLFAESSKRYSTEGGIWPFIKYIYLIPYRSLIMVMLPWSLILVALLKKEIRKQAESTGIFILLSWLTVINMLPYLIAPDFSPRYLYPFLPFAAILLAKLLNISYHYINERKAGKWVSALIIILFLVLFIIPFTAYFRKEEMIWLKSLMLGLIFLSLLVLLNTRRINVFLSLVFVLILTRFFVNYIYLPAYQDHEFSFREKCAELMDYAGEEEIFLTGPKDQLAVSFSLGNFEIEKSRRMIIIPPVIPDQITFHYSRSRNKIFHYTSEPESGSLCLARKDFQPPYKTRELLVFDDHFKGHELVLYRVLDTKRNSRDSMAILDPW